MLLGYLHVRPEVKATFVFGNLIKVKMFGDWISFFNYRFLLELQLWWRYYFLFFLHHRMAPLLREHFRKYIIRHTLQEMIVMTRPWTDFPVGVEAPWCWEKKALRTPQWGRMDVRVWPQARKSTGYSQQTPGKAEAALPFEERRGLEGWSREGAAVQIHINGSLSASVPSLHTSQREVL